MTGATEQATDQRGVSPLVPIVASQLLTGTASWSLLIGVFGYATYQLQAGAIQLGLLGLAWGAPSVLLGLLVGRLIDSRGPKELAVVSGVVNIAVSIWLSFTSSWELLLILLLAAGIGKAFNQPAVDAMPTWLVRTVDQRTASVWLGFATQTPLVLGPLIAAGMITAATFSAVYLVNAALHAIALITTLFVRTRAHLTGEPGHSGRRDRSPLAGRARVILGLSFVVWISYSCYDVLEILYVRDVLGSAVGVFTLLQVVFGVGLLVANLVMMRFTRVLTSYRALVGSVVFIGVAEAVYVCTDQFVVAAIGAVLFGVGVAVFGPVCRSSLLESVPEQQHGAAMAAWRSAQSAGSVIPPLVLGGAGQLFGTQLTMIATATLVVLAGAGGWLARR